ncbi:SKT5-like protein [Ecytonucleospora hepatopenaei]|nr:hypothetical protein EHP00_2638 [Ecytonucleospora hepatopenaei]OQS54186.1 SKT5-like protein [Ecytonucleospora hepatopenaei]
MKENKRHNKDFDQTINLFLKQTLAKSYENKKHSKKYKGEAYAFMGVGYEYGIFNLESNPSYAFEKYETAAQLGNALGTFKLGQCFEKGFGVYASTEKALSFYRCAAKLGLTEALHLYGMIMFNGYIGAMKDENTGHYYLKMAVKNADKYCPYPLYDMGLFYENGENSCGITKDFSFSLENYEKGAELGDPNCKYKMGQCYEYGDMGLDIDKKKSAQFYTEAANSGQIDAQWILSEYYLTGKKPHIEKSYEKSYGWALAGATKGSERCAFKCGECALSGTGTEENILDAYFWFLISKYLGSADADDKIKEVEHKLAKMDAGAEVPSTCCSCLFG